MTAHADPRLVIAVLERAAEMLDGGAWAPGIIVAAVSEVARQRAAIRLRADAARLRDHLLSVALFCGALAGALDTIRPGPDGAPVVDTRIRELIALHISGDQIAIVALRDLVEERALATDLGAWAPVERRQRWIETGPHEHAWHVAIGEGIGERRSTMSVGVGGPIVRLCTCGLYEHEFTGPRWDAVEIRGVGGHLERHPARWPTRYRDDPHEVPF